MHHSAKRLLIVAVLICAMFCVCDSLFYLQTPIDTLAIKENVVGENGVWLRYLWYRGKHNESEWQEMLKRLKNHKIRYAYFHVLDVKKNGRLAYHQLKEARQITERMHAACPETLCLPWIYIPSDFGRKDGVSLSDAQTRLNMHSEAKWLIDECGFDGIHWDYEFAPDGDTHFVQFLQESRKSIPAHKHLSIASPMSYPFTLWGWSDEYFKKVAPHVDQIAVMSYDSYLYEPRAYSALVARQVINVSQDMAAVNPDGKVIIGLPTYRNKTLAHLPFSENLGTALRGLAQGLKTKRFLDRETNNAKTNNVEGAAIFADYTTNPSDWNLFDRALKK